MKTILILEDEDTVMRLLRHILNDYATVEASTAQEAVRLFQNHRARVELLVADVSLPSSSGIAVAGQLRQENPALPVIFVSGYPISAWNTRDVEELNGLGTDSVAVVQKPFLPKPFRELVHRLIERVAGADGAGCGLP